MFTTGANNKPLTGSYAAGWDDFDGWDGDFVNRIIRPKEEWAGFSDAHAYDPVMPWASRQHAQRAFTARSRKVQRAVHKLKGMEFDEKQPLAAKLQLAAFHTNCPNPAQVAVGQAAFLELKAITLYFSEDLAGQCMRQAQFLAPHLPPLLLQALIANISKTLAVRAVLEEASRYPELVCVEYYRLFQAAQSSMKFPHLADCIEAVILYGDVLPDLDALPLHPMTAQILDVLLRRSIFFLKELPRTDLAMFRKFFSAWANELTIALLPFMPSADSKRERRETPAGAQNARGGAEMPAGTPKYQYGDEQEHAGQEYIPPLDEPRPPVLSKERSVETKLQSVLDAIENKPDTPEEPFAERDLRLENALRELQQTAFNASGQTSDYGDKREDLMAQELAQRPFSEGPIEGTPTEGRTIEFELDGKTVGGEIMERCVELSDDVEKVRQLEKESGPISAALRAILYPSEKDRGKIELFHTSGGLDPRRLPIAEVREAVYRRFRVHKEPSAAGKAVLVIAADASGSLNPIQMRMCKLLMAGWLQSARNSNVEILAGFYHSDCHQNVWGPPLVEWVYHPRKTPVFMPAEALRSIAALQDTAGGSGVQSDALSIKLILDQAVQLSRGSRLYLILVSDLAWNKCFPESRSTPEEEVAMTLDGFREDLGDRLHVTLVALGERNHERIKNSVDKIVSVKEEALARPDEVAREIGSYVAAIVRERRRAPKRRA